MRCRSVVTLAFVLLAAVAFAQQAPVPTVMRIAGTVPAAASAAFPVTFSLFAEQTGGAALWSETQTITFDPAGRYAVVLGQASAEGVPVALFSDGTARWLAVEVPGLPEQPRILLTSVAYALKAADAETVGGRPLSSFVLAGETTGVGADGLTYIDKRVLDKALSGSFAVPTTSGSQGYIAKFTTTVDLGNSAMFQSGTSIGVGTTTPAAALHVAAAAAPAAFFEVYNNLLGQLPAVYRAARGTPSAPTAVQTNDILGGLAVRGYGATGFGSGVGQVMFRAAQNFTDTAQGTFLQFTTTPLNSNAWVERMRISPEGYLGIGTSTPLFPVDAQLAIGGATYARFGTFTPLFLIANNPHLGFNVYWGGGYKYGSSQPAGYLAFDQDSTGGFSFATAPAGVADASATMTPRMVILNDGKVGIGTTAPTHTLDVTGTLNTTGVISSASYVDADWAMFSTSTAGYTALFATSSGTGGTAGLNASVTSTSGKAITASVAGTERMSVDINGVHAGPGMTPTPIAHGFFNNVGTRVSGSTNLSCLWSAASSWYVCTIAGVTYDYDGFTTVVTPAGASATVFGSTDGLGSDLLVAFHNLSGARVQAPYGFAVTIFKQ